MKTVEIEWENAFVTYEVGGVESIVLKECPNECILAENKKCYTPCANIGFGEYFKRVVSVRYKNEPVVQTELSDYDKFEYDIDN